MEKLHILLYELSGGLEMVFPETKFTILTDRKSWI